MPDRYCSKCNSKMQPCPKCDGSGTVPVFSLLGGWGGESCRHCNGIGYLCPRHGTSTG